MHGIIVGGNATGKTLYLYNKVVEGVKGGQSARIATNVQSLYALELQRYQASAKKVQILDSILLDCDAVLDGSSMAFINGSDSLSDNCKRALRLLCANVDFGYFDEIDAGLYTGEKRIVLEFLMCIKDFYKELILTSHNLDYMEALDMPIYTLDMVHPGELVLLDDWGLIYEMFGTI